MPARKVSLESHQQVLFVARVRTFLPEILIFAVPNGGNRNPREAANLKKEGVLAGVPDLVVAEPRGRFHGLYIEMKRADGKGATSKAQKDVMARLVERGYAVSVCHGQDEAWERLNDYLAER